MKKIIANNAVLFVLLAAALFQSCLKDTATTTYTMYAPVYKTVAEVRAGIKNGAAMPIVNPGKIFIQGNYIFLNEIDKGVHIIDNTNPSAPVNKHFISIPGNLDVAVKGNFLYADMYRDLLTIDISNPAAIKVKKITENAFPRRNYLNGFIGDTTRVIVDWIKKDTTTNKTITNWNNGGVLVLDNASQNFASATASKSTGVSGSMARFTVLNNYLYTVTNADLNVFNIAQAENPVFTNKVAVGWNIETIYPFKNNLFIGSQNGMYIFSAANPAQPNQTSMFPHVTVCDPVIADDNYAYVTLRTGTLCRGSINQLDILNIQNLQNPQRVKTYPLSNPFGLSKDGNTLIVCDGAAGLKFFEGSDVANLTLASSISGINAYDVIAQNNVALVVAKDGLYQYNYSNPWKPVLLSKSSYK